MRTHLFVFAAFSAFTGLACAGSAPPPPATVVAAAPSATPAAASAPSVAPAATPRKAAGEAKVGDRTNCPTSGEEFVVTASSPKVDYKGKTYYFCCSGCDQKFAADPEKYLGQRKAAEGT